MSHRRNSTASRVPCALTPLLPALLLFQSLLSVVSARWQTLNGNPPSVIAHGGFSGIFPDSSSLAYQLALTTSLSNVTLWCDVQLTKDGVGICAPGLRLENYTNIARIFKRRDKMYLVNGTPTRGWFPVDFNFDDLSTVVLTQGIYSRTGRYDGNAFQIQTPKDVAQLKPSGLWLNIQHDAFFAQHNLNMKSYLLSLSGSTILNYISSPEVAFLRSIAGLFDPSVTKLVFRFMEPDEIEPSSNQTYNSLLMNMTFIRTFASGILIPKVYIWPIDGDLYLQPHTSIVLDAHKAGLEVFASEFYNDAVLSYNYSYDPVTEYLNFIDNGYFSVDGLLSDFPITPSAAIDCFAHLEKNAPEQVKLLVISKNGASGDYPGCTDLAYQKAIADGADAIDCSVQMSRDGIPFCLSSINLIDNTRVVQSKFSNFTTTIPEIKTGVGIFTFDLLWSQIQTLASSTSNPYSNFRFFRNPKFRNSGKFLTLSDFLALAKNATSLSGLLIRIEHAAYLIEKQGLPIIDAVLDALRRADYENHTNIKVMIQSSNSSVLLKFKERSNYELVYEVDKKIGDALDSTIEKIKTFANSVVINKFSVFPENALFLTEVTDIVRRLQSSKLNVYVETFSNEFVSQAWDFYSDANVEINSYVSGTKINGVITDFPRTAARYKRNRCLNLSDSTPAYMSPVQPGGLLQLITSQYLPPAKAQNPVLTVSDVMESPLPSVTPRVLPSSTPDGEASGHESLMHSLEAVMSSALTSLKYYINQ